MKIKINFPETNSHDTELILSQYSASEKWQRAGKTFSIFLGLSLFSIVIPIFHFILVPGFFFAAFYFSYKRLMEVAFFNLKEFKCPKCDHSLDEKELVFTKKDQIKRVFCFNCRNYIRFDCC